MKTLLLTLFSIMTFFSFSQVQLGSSIDGQSQFETFGASVASSLDGTIIVAGAPYLGNSDAGIAGAVRVYEITTVTNDWTQVGQDINGDLVDGIFGDQFGTSVSISNDGTIIAGGARLNDSGADDAGQVRIFENQGGTWTQLGQDINGTNVEDFLGASVSLSGDGTIIAMGAIQNDSNTGKVKVYEYQSSTTSWIQLGQDINGETLGDRFGISISLSDDGTIVAIGGNLNDGVNGANSGHVRVYENQNGNWTQIGQDIDGDAADDLSGQVSLSADGTIVGIGASGYVRVYENQNGNWTQIGQNIIEPTSGTVSISHSGNVLAVGNPTAGYIGPFGNSNGYVRVYQNNAGTWQVTTDFGGANGSVAFGRSICISGDGNYVAAGGPASNNTGVFSNMLIGEVRNLFTFFDTTLNVNEFNNTVFKITYNKDSQQLQVILSNNTKHIEKINLYTINGQLLHSVFDLTINTEHLTSGIYIVELETTTGKMAKKVVIH